MTGLYSDAVLEGIAQTNLQLFNQMHRGTYSHDDIGRAAQAYQLATRLFANQFRACGKPFVSHLLGTASILVMLNVAIDVVIAELLHAVYQEGDYPNALPGMTPAKRKQLEATAGEQVEALVAAYTSGSRSLEGIRASHARFQQMSEFDRTVLLMQLANELDDYRDLAAHHTANALERIDKVRQCGDLQVEMARNLGYPQLADLLYRIYAATLNADIPVSLRSEFGNGYSILPPSCIRAPANLALRAVRKGRRLLGKT